MKIRSKLWSKKNCNCSGCKFEAIEESDNKLGRGAEEYLSVLVHFYFNF